MLLVHLTDGVCSTESEGLDFIGMWMDAQLQFKQVHLHLKVLDVRTILHHFPADKGKMKLKGAVCTTVEYQYIYQTPPTTHNAS